MKLAIAGFGLESVTFLPETTGVADFERSALRGQAVIEQTRGTNSVLGGMVEVAEADGIELHGIVSVNAGAAAAASDEAYERYRAEIVSGLEALRNQIDGCLLHLHGALATPTVGRADAGVLAAIREAMGEDFPIAVGMDLHGNLGEANIQHATVVAGYHYSPHTDMAQTGARAAKILVRALRGEIQPVMAIAKPGIILPSIFSATRLEPLADLIRDARAVEQAHEHILDISIFCGFAYADVPDCGMSVVVVADGGLEQADDAATRLADKAWRLRERLFKRELLHGVQSGLNRAQAIARTSPKPVCILEHADRLNDSTYTLREMLRRGLRRAYAPNIFDPDAIRECVAAGAGARVHLDLAGKTSPEAGGTLQVEAEVLFAGEKRYTVTGPLYTGATIDLGATALIRIHGIVVSLIGLQWSAIDLDCFHVYDLKPEDFDYVLLRSKTHFRHVYESLCAAIVIVETPDWGPGDVTRLEYVHADANAFPLRAKE